MYALHMITHIMQQEDQPKKGVLLKDGSPLAEIFTEGDVATLDKSEQ